MILSVRFCARRDDESVSNTAPTTPQRQEKQARVDTKTATKGSGYGYSLPTDWRAHGTANNIARNVFAVAFASRSIPTLSSTPLSYRTSLSYRFRGPEKRASVATSYPNTNIASDKGRT